MANNVTLPATGAVVETIDEGSGVERQVIALGSIGAAGAETQLTAGQKTAAASIPVVSNSDPDYRPAASNITAPDIVSAAATGQDGQSLVTGAPSAGSFAAWAINGRGTARIQVTNVWTGTLQFEGSVDGGTTWFPQPARVSGTAFSRSAITGNGLFDVVISGLTNVRVRASAMAAGTATVQPAFTSLEIAAHPGGIGVLGQRPAPIVKGALNNSQTSYAQNSCVGGLITIAGLQPMAILTAWNFRFKALYSASNAGGFSPIAFDANPTASTYVDNVAQSLAAADLAKAIAIIGGGTGFLQNGTGGLDVLTFAGPRIQVDANGNIYVAVIAGAGVTFGAANSLLWEFDGTY